LNVVERVDLVNCINEALDDVVCRSDVTLDARSQTAGGALE
jgi:hypothetical protein